MRVVVGGLTLLAAIGASALGRAGPAPAGVDDPAANIVVITSDDQDAASVAEMPTVLERIGNAGARFDQSLVNLPLCCPSRATFLTGQYPHNNGVVNNLPPNGGFQALDSANTLPAWLQEAGYHTAMIGKYLNGYEQTEPTVPVGWSEWHAMRAVVYLYYGYTLLEGGVETQYGSPSENPDDPAAPETYLTDVLTDKAVDLIDQRAPSDQPFFLWLTYLAPHGGGPGGPATRCHDSARPAHRHLGDYDGEALPAPPNLNEANVTDKPRIVRSRPRITPAGLEQLEIDWRCRRETLQAADEGVGAVLDALEANGELDNTLVVFTSDNGLLFGEHRYVAAKRHPYEEAIRVPLVMRGPGIAAGTRVRELAFNNDLAATVLDVTGAEASVPQDGRSLIPLARRPELRRGRELLIRGPGWVGVRNHRFTYVKRHDSAGGGSELYDLRSDPFQLRSLGAAPGYRDQRKRLRERLGELRKCAGRECRKRPAMRLRAVPFRCAAGRAPVRVAGGDAEALAVVRFRLGSGGARRDRRAPFQVRVPPSGVDGVTAVANLVDGRRTTLAATKRRRCSRG